jgi:hypothetical protein
MPSTWTNNLSIEKPATGEQAGVWGTTANNNFDYLDTGIDGNITIRLSASGYDLVTGTGVSEGRNKVVIFTGALTSDVTINIKPNTAQKVYFAVNHTTGGFSLRFVQGTGSSFTLRANQSAVIYADGLGSPASVSGVLSDFQVNSLLVLSSLVIAAGGQISFASAQTVPVAMAFTGGVTISPSLTLNLTNDAPYDMYYRSAAGPMARLANGTPGQILTVGGAGPAWAAPVTVGIGSGISGAAPSEVLYTDAASKLAQSANFQYTPAAGLSVGRSPATGYGITVGTPGKIMLDAAANNIREIVYATSSVLRWSLRLNSDAEGGSNTGASFSLVGFADNGAALSFPIYCSRVGRTTIGTNGDYPNALTVVGTAPTLDILSVRAPAGQSGKLQSWYGTSGLVAWVDNDGTIGSIVPPAGGFLKLDANKRLDINGTVAGHPLSTLHLGPDSFPTSTLPNPSIALEAAVGFGSVGPASVCRFYFRSAPNPQRLVIQFNTGSGSAVYAYLDLTSGVGPANWFITTNPT